MVGGEERLKERFSRKRQTGVSQVLFSRVAAIAYEAVLESASVATQAVPLCSPPLCSPLDLLSEW